MPACDLLCYALIAREQSSYRAADIWRLMGRVHSLTGLPRLGWQKERGSWAANIIDGENIVAEDGGPAHPQRVGGLCMLPSNLTRRHVARLGAERAAQWRTLRTFTSYLPKSKSVEGVFHRLQKFVEDSHHLGPRCLGLIISLIDESPGEWLLSAVDSLWTRMQTKAYQEVEQLRVNRLAEKITLGPAVRERDVERLLERRVKWAASSTVAVKAVLPLLVEKANLHGRLAFVREVVKRASDKAGGEAVTAEDFADAIESEIAGR